jgi:predicted DNA-binding transcriptional regulator AlpA
MSLRVALRMPALKRATGKGHSQIYKDIEEGLLPKGVRLFPTDRSVIWWEDEIVAIQQAAAERPEPPDTGKYPIRRKPQVADEPAPKNAMVAHLEPDEPRPPPPDARVGRRKRVAAQGPDQSRR